MKIMVCPLYCPFPVLIHLCFAPLNGLLFSLLLFLKALRFFGLGTPFLSPMLKPSRYSIRSSIKVNVLPRVAGICDQLHGVRKEGFGGTLQQQRVLKQIPGPPVIAPVVTALPRVVGKGGQSHVERMMVQKGTPPLQRLLGKLYHFSHLNKILIY